MKTLSHFSGKRILIVDDEEELRKALVFEFKRKGCFVLEAASGNEAYALAEKENFDVVITDVRMPNGTGVELLEKMKKICPGLPVILLMTGHADISEPEAIKKGAIGLVGKPIDRKKMFQLISDLFP